MLMSDELCGSIALVTGATRGIGHAIATRLARAGCDVWLGARNPDNAEAAVAATGAAGAGLARVITLDVADPASVQSAFRAVAKQSGRLDILVNNAGIMHPAAIEMTSAGSIDETFATNIRGLLLCSQYAARQMSRAGKGTIINLASIMGRFGYPGQAAYAASKAAVIGATTSLAKELAGRGIRVNAIAPGVIETDMIGRLSDEQRDAVLAKIAMSRLGSPDEVAELCLFLASPRSSYITGQIIGIDGGMVI